MNYRHFWYNILHHTQHIKRDYLTLDIDEETGDFNVKVIKRIIKHMNKSIFPNKVRKYVIEENTLKKGHFHVKVWFEKPIPLWQIILMRILAYDDIKRIRCDLIRLGHNTPHLIDYLANIKFHDDKPEKNLSLYKTITDIT